MEQTATAKKGLKKGWRIVLTVLAVLLIIYAVMGLLPRGKNYSLTNPMMKEGDLPLLIAHGGGNKEFPDNTLEAFYNAYSVDKNVMMETDVSITKDGVLILSHDTTLDRKTNVTGSIVDWNYSDLIAQKVDFSYTNPTEGGVLSGDRVRFADENGGRRFPTDVEYPEGIAPRDETVFLATTLEELMTAFPNNRINVEIKQSGELGMNDALCQMYYAKSGIARFICKKLGEKLKKSEAAGIPDLNTLFQYNMPFRAIAKMTGGMVSMEMVEGLLKVVNGHFSGLGKVISGFFRNQKLNKQYEKDLEEQK